VTTEFTREWFKDLENQQLIAKANRMAQSKICHPFSFFQWMAYRDLVWSAKDLEEQGWSPAGIKKYLSDDVIFSFKGIDVYLAGAVTEAVLAMPNCIEKTNIIIRKLCQ
jgi:hypothetical protein